MRRLVPLILCLFACGVQPALASSGDTGDTLSAPTYGELVRSGHTALQAGEKGRAALYYERARVLSDASKSVRQNLRLLREESGALEFDLPVHPLVRGVFFMYYASSRSDLVAMMYFGTLFLLGFIGYSTFTGRKIAYLTNLVYSVAIVFIVSTCLVYIHREREARAPDRAVILSPVPLYARPDARETALTLLPESSAVRIVGAQSAQGAANSEGLIRILLPNGASGYVAASGVARINDFKK